MLSLNCGTDAMKVWDLIPPERRALTKLKLVSLRNKSWFRELTSEQRRFMDAVVMVVEKIHSLILLRLLAPVVMKLISVLERRNSVKGHTSIEILTLTGKTAYVMIRGIALKVSKIAQAWGNKSASKWPEDPGFIKYLIIMNLAQNKNPLTFTLCA